MSDKKDNVIMFPTKAKVPNTLTISFDDSEPVTYVLSDSGNIDLSGLDTISVDVSQTTYDYLDDWYLIPDDNMSVTLSSDIVTDVTVTVMDDYDSKQLSLNFDTEDDGK